MRDYEIFVPSSLLLCGEYNVLETGGMGIILSLEPYLCCEITLGKEWVLEGIMGGAKQDYTSNEHSLLRRMFDCQMHILKGKGYQPRLARLCFDSQEFFYHSQHKKGYGSSASLSVALALALLRLSDFSQDSLREDAFFLALQAHRLVQNQKGSGYDIVASLFGGLRVFSGGVLPKHQELLWKENYYVYLFHGQQSYPTSQALELFYRWKAQHNVIWKLLFDLHNAWINKAIDSWGTSDLLPALCRCKEMGILIGDYVGCNAKIEFPYPKLLNDRSFYKAVGAGNELGVFVSLDQISEQEHPLLEKLNLSSGAFWKDATNSLIC